jgi:hypothetical protein
MPAPDRMHSRLFSFGAHIHRLDRVSHITKVNSGSIATRGQLVCTASVKLKLTAGLWIAGVCLAQNWEIGGGVGYSWYHNGSITSSAGTATAGIRNRILATAVITENLYEHFSGEIRYVYNDGPTFLQSSGVSGDIRAQSHSFSYDMLAHLNPRESRIRPYLAGGVGARYYETTGRAPIPQPVPHIAALVPTTQWKALFNFGGGVKIRVTEHIIFRADLRDYLTPFPDRLFLPVANATTHGILQQITPMFGVSAGF